MRIGLAWLYGISFEAGHVCQIRADCEQSGSYRRCLDEAFQPPECMHDHIVGGQITPMMVLVMSYDEYAAYYGQYYGIATPTIDTLTGPYRGIMGYWKHSVSRREVYLDSWRSAYLPVGALPPAVMRAATQVSSDVTHYVQCRILSVPAGTYRGKVFIGCTFSGTMRNVVFDDCLFSNCTFLDMTLSHVQFDRCFVQGQATGSTLEDVSGLAQSFVLVGSRMVLRRVRLQVVYPVSYEIRDSVVIRCVLPGAMCVRCATKTTAVHTCVLCKRRQPGTRIHAHAWLCDACKTNKYANRYDNEDYKGKQDRYPVFSFELETAGGNADDCLGILAYGFLPTSDSTVDVEYKSPRYLSLAAALPALHYVDTFASTNINSQCGTHVHVDCVVKRQIDGAVFGPLTRYLTVHEQETRQFWGRSFGTYCTPALDSGSRYEAFSLHSGHETIEYRLPRFRTAKQFLAVLRFCRQTTKLLTETYTYTPSHLIDVPALGRTILANYRQALAAVVR